MSIDWRDTLRTLLPQFEAVAARSRGLHHLYVEVADTERHKMMGPPWLSRGLDKVRMVDGKPAYDKWDCCALPASPFINPSFREPRPNEAFDEGQRVIRDESGVVRAVPVPMRLRQAFYCGDPSEINSFESLANTAAQALASASDLSEHYLAPQLADLFRKPRGGIRYVFGDVPAAPKHFISSGWDAGVLKFEDGILIDLPISEMPANAASWLLMLHRLGWMHLAGVGLNAERWAWQDNFEVSYSMLESGHSSGIGGFKEQIQAISRDSYYSVLGSKAMPQDVSLASVLGIKALLAELESTSEVKSTSNIPDFSEEEWFRQQLPTLKSVSLAECQNVSNELLGMLVATEVERIAVLKRMRPPKHKRSVYQVHHQNNTYYFGRLGPLHIVLCMSAMGSIGRDSSTIVTSELIEAWQPSAVVMVGIAFGKDSSKQKAGCVLVSDRVEPYEPQRIGKEEFQDRGTPLPAGVILLNRCRNTLGWAFADLSGECPGFQFGPLLSGEKLVDNQDFKQSLFKRYSTAIGGEMEGAGVAAAASRKNLEWVLVKAICDWGDGSKTKYYQEFAAAAAVSFVEHVFNQPGALDALGK